MRSITDIVRQFKQDWTEQLCPENIERACRDCGITWIESTLNPVVTIQLFLLQVMHGNTACTHLPHLARVDFIRPQGRETGTGPVLCFLWVARGSQR